MDSFNTPSRPVPQFFDNHSFTTKKSRTSTPSCKKIPPRPPSKSVPPISRLFVPPKRSKAQAITSFKENNDISLSKCYDESREESYFDQCFQIECKLGSGSFGDVFKVRSKEDGNYYAIKKSRERFKGKSDRERKLQEVLKHEQLPKHPNCVRLYNAWEDRQQLYIQTELCEKSLSEFAEENHDIPERIIWNILVDLLKAVHHLHEHDLIHLDIKPDNIFIANDGTFKLGDFGLVLDLKKNDTNEATEGDPKYLAKELMQATFTKSADIFSLGITILELACDLDLPSGGEGWHVLRNGKIPADLFEKISLELKLIITMMMHPNYKRRPTASQLLQHPKISEINKQRTRELRLRKLTAVLKNHFSVFLSFFVQWFFILNNTIRRLFRRLFYRPTNQPNTTPPHNSYSKNSQSDWDGNYSDDDVFDNSLVNQNSGFFDTSSSSCESRMQTSFDYRSDSPRQFCSTTAVQRNVHRPIFDPLMSPSFKTSSPIAKSYDDERPRMLTRSKASNQKLNFCDIDADDSFELDKSTSLVSIGPKNLLSTFDEIEDDSDET